MPRGPKGERRSADVIGAAIMVAKIATGARLMTTLARRQSALRVAASAANLGRQILRHNNGHRSPMQPQRRGKKAPLAPDRGHHCLYPKDVERPSRIVDERREAELGAHVIDASHQEGALIHPLRFWSTKA